MEITTGPGMRIDWFIQQLIDDPPVQDQITIAFWGLNDLMYKGEVVESLDGQFVTKLHRLTMLLKKRAGVALVVGGTANRACAISAAMSAAASVG